MKKSFVYRVAACGMLFASQSVMAHPGHGHESPLSPGHYVVNPEHAIQLLLIMAASIAFAWLVSRKGSRAQEK
jgi:hypothetical protein